MNTARRFLYMRTDRLGDTLMCLPAVHFLRISHPKSWITWMVSKDVAPILQGNPDVDEIYPVDMARFEGNAAYRSQLTRDLRKGRFDTCIVANASKHAHWLALALGAPMRVGWRRKWPFLLTRSLSDDKSFAGRHETESNIALVKLVCQGSPAGQWSFPVDPKAEEAMRQRLRHVLNEGDKIAVVHAGTSHPDKKWPIERFGDVCRYLMSAKKSRVVLIGGSEEEPTSRAVAAIAPGVIDWTGALSLPELSALMASAQVKTLLSSDSGPVHVAWLHHKPVVALYAANKTGSDPRRWGALSAGSVCIHKAMDQISVDEVKKALDGILS